jgi:predicted nuclease of restriction endonuclease-like (RecB) superfamily
MEKAVINHFQQIQSLILEGKAKAVQAATSYSLATYWEVGSYLNQELTDGVYGKRIVSQLADWLLEQDATLKGFDKRNLYRMRDFFEVWSNMDWSLLPKNIQDSQIYNGIENMFTEQKIVVSPTPQSFVLPKLMTRISWTHHIEILRGAISKEERLFYLILSIKDRYTVMELRRQIESGLFERQMSAKYTMILPEHPQKEELTRIFRDRYLFEFLDLQNPYSEFELKKALIARMKQFLLELGRDFIFIDEEFPVRVGMNDYFIDLVFYHRELQCLVAFDLKTTAFEPEYLGKMNFYLENLDRDVKKPHENPSIGVILCKSKNDEVVEIAMSRQLSPTMVSVYETKFLDKNLLRKKLQQWTEEWENAQRQI